jgi:hypothetical protein
MPHKRIVHTNSTGVKRNARGVVRFERQYMQKNPVLPHPPRYFRENRRTVCATPHVRCEIDKEGVREGSLRL